MDLFNFIDVVALLPDRILGIQACGETDFNAHVAKIEAAPLLPAWLATGALIEIWSWRKTRPRGTKLVRWRCRRFQATKNVEGGCREWLELLD